MKSRHTSIERVLAELLRQLHEVPLRELHLAFQASLLGILPRSSNLEVVVVDTNDVHVREPGDFPRGTTNATADIEDTHAGLEVHLRGEVVLVTCERGEEGLALVEAGEVERLGPTVLVELSSTIVVT